MAYLPGNNKLQQGQPGQQQSQQMPGGMQPLGGQVSDPTQATPGAGQQQSSVITPGSVGGGGSGGATPAWTNIQSYLKANPNQTNVEEGFKERADKVVQDEGQRKQDYFQEVRQPFEQVKQAYQTVSGSGDANQALRGSLVNQIKQGADYTDNFLDSTNQIMNTDFQNMFLNPYQTGDQYGKMRGALDDNNQFLSMVDDINQERAGQRLSSGQSALQRQLDLSSGQFGSAREAALERLAGVDQNVKNLNSTLDQDAQMINQFGNYQQKLKNQLVGSGDEYLKEFATNQWDPMLQRQENWQKAYKKDSLDPLKQGVTQAMTNWADGSGMGLGNLLGNNADIRSAYDSLQSAQATTDSQDIQKWLDTLYSNNFSERPFAESLGGGDLNISGIDPLRQQYANWLSSNKDRIFV